MGELSPRNDLPQDRTRVKHLLLLRHGKSGWDDPSMRDFDRPLTPRGERASRAMGKLLRKLAGELQTVIVSPARRTVDTLAQVEAGYGAALRATTDERVYMASAATLLDVIHEFDPQTATAMIIGHNPGLEDLALDLAATGENGLRETLYAKFPTAALAVITLNNVDWESAGKNSGHLTHFIRPRDVDPALATD